MYTVSVPAPLQPEESFENGVPVDELKDVYSQKLGHKCAIERFLVVGDVGPVASPTTNPRQTCMSHLLNPGCTSSRLPASLKTPQRASRQCPVSTPQPYSALAWAIYLALS